MKNIYCNIVSIEIYMNSNIKNKIKNKIMFYCDLNQWKKKLEKLNKIYFKRFYYRRMEDNVECLVYIEDILLDKPDNSGFIKWRYGHKIQQYHYIKLNGCRPQYIHNIKTRKYLKVKTPKKFIYSSGINDESSYI